MANNPKQSAITYRDFQVFNADGSRKKGVIKAFLIETMLTDHDLMKERFFYEGQNLTLICHPALRHEINQMSGSEAIISIQFRNCGHYAIAELKKNNKD